jgi:hypothetical protein
MVIKKIKIVNSLRIQICHVNVKLKTEKFLSEFIIQNYRQNTLTLFYQLFFIFELSLTLFEKIEVKNFIRERIHNLSLKVLSIDLVSNSFVYLFLMPMSI